jgi:hemerythrin superfamily protein
MSLFDKAVAAVTPPESEEDRMEARQRARETSSAGGWLATILDHHLQLEDAFAATKAAPDASSRMTATKQLGVLLTGHAIAEENAIYPAMASGGEKGEAEMAYNEQALVKMQMAELEKLDPMSDDFLDKLEHIRGAVAHHMYEEEGTWFPDLANSASAEDQRMMTEHYMEAFDRFVGADAMA